MMEKEKAMKLCSQLADEVSKIYAGVGLPLQQLREVVELVNKQLAALRVEMEMTGFGSEQKEIDFFKLVKPGIRSWLLYAADRFAIDLACPVGVSSKQMDYYLKELDYVQRSLQRFPLHYAYFRQGMTELDRVYFLRGSGGDVPTGQPGDDQGFSTPCDYLWAKFMAGGQVIEYLVGKIGALEKGLEVKGVDDGAVVLTKPVVVPMRWTGEKVHLIELCYALFFSGQIDNGKLGVMEFFARVGAFFEIDLGIPKRGFEDVKSRKRLSRTHFLEVLQKGLEEKFDAADEYRPESRF
ncbi:RteC domain-containing protein [Pedobacter jeongneungensis]|uniref:RteC domain-containing protein n=1 Tax=Pedobacter jeongneungensis TaxID=947309 RepID=UPI0004A7AD2E|nr:RteC domain-containing protein [Pedobacter jeongneungensis]